MVTGYSGNTYTYDYRIPLTTVSQPRQDIARTACLLLKRIILGKTVKNRQVVIPCPLIIRASTARKKK